MRSTLIIPDALYAELKRRAAETGKTISGLVSEFVWRGLSVPSGGGAEAVSPLRTFRGSHLLVDISDREALDRVLDSDRDAHSFGPAEG